MELTRTSQRPHGWIAALLAVALLAASSGVVAQNLKSGELVYEESCSACHKKGMAKAPKLGDQKAWARLIKEGQPGITAHGWVGVRLMPPRGGDSELSLEEFARATAYMARNSGADWRDPDAAMMQAIRSEEKKYLAKAQK